MIEPTANMCRAGGERIKIELAETFLDDEGRAYNVPALWCIRTAEKIYQAMERCRVKESQ